ncbi:unnamed protein product [Rotaria sordida]|uniref:Uncharacterized protein n=1 Tax=Rotaria sordida TaxID=392033 RepID=A0A813RKV1_9BILA|nr:unnamed protein product [Rotaria sordida]CAF3525522.1 unnamed protein product [Rotaria sordida]
MLCYYFALELINDKDTNFTQDIGIFYNTVIKHITKDSSNRRIIQIDAIQRSQRQTSFEHRRFLSEELPDWYSKEDSS